MEERPQYRRGCQCDREGYVSGWSSSRPWACPFQNRTRTTYHHSPKKVMNLSKHLIDRDRGETFFALGDAELEVAAPAIDLVVENAMLFSVGKPHARLVAGRENCYARCLNHCGEV